MAAILLFYSLCSWMVKGEHLWLSMKTSKRDWKRVNHNCTTWSTSSYNSTFSFDFCHVDSSVGPDFSHDLLVGQNKLPSPSHNTEQRELKDAAFDRLILETFFYNLLKNDELMCYLVRSISVLSKRFCSIAWPNWGQVPCTDLHYKTNTETFAHWRTLYASQRETTRVQLLHEKSQRNTEYYWGGSS
jgi:hypothetical protein